MNYSLKAELDNCYSYADSLDNDGYGARQKTGLKTREMLQFDLLQFLAYLSSSNQAELTLEIKFIREYLNQHFTTDRFRTFKYERTTGDFASTPPRSLTYFVQGDLARMKVNPNAVYRSRDYVRTFKLMGQEFIACNNLTDEGEIAKLTGYCLMLDKYLKSMNLYAIDPSPLLDKYNALPKNTPTANQTGSATVTAKPEPVKDVDTLLEELDSMTGLESVKKDITNLVNLLKIKKLREENGMKQPSVSLHLVFSGNPGTGKTTVARLLANIYKGLGVLSRGQLVEVDRGGLVVGYIGQTAKKTREVLESALGGVLFIDEAYSLSQGSENDFGKEAIDEILKFMEDHRKDMVIIFAGYTKEMSEFLQMNSGLASRIPHTFDFEDYTPDEIVKIGLLGLHNAAYEVDEAAYADLVKNNYSLTSDHSNGRWVRNLNEELIMVMSERVAHAEDADINQILQEDLDAVRAGNHGMRTLKSTEEGTEKVVADEKGYAVPPGSN